MERLVRRTEFERLRDLREKVIREDIKLTKRKALASVRVTKAVPIENSLGYDLKLHVKVNTETGEKTICVVASGVGPICRLDVDGHEHGASGRSHKHALQSERCPDGNLPCGVRKMDGVSGSDIVTLFGEFCKLANIQFLGRFDTSDID